MNPADAIQAAPVAHDMSLWGLFWSAHIVVKLVMLGLLAASVWCWAIIVDKTLLFIRVKRAMDRFEEVFWSGQSLEELYLNLQSRANTGLAAVSKETACESTRWSIPPRIPTTPNWSAAFGRVAARRSRR